MKAPRYLTQREREVARLAAQRTKDDALALIAGAMRVYSESGSVDAVRVIGVIDNILRENVQTVGVVTEL